MRTLTICLFYSSLSFGQGKLKKQTQMDQYSSFLMTELQKMSNYNLGEFTKAANKLKFEFLKKSVVDQGLESQQNVYVFIFSRDKRGVEESSMFLSRSISGDLINLAFYSEDLYNSLEGEMNRRKYKKEKPYVSVSELECRSWKNQNQKLNLCMGLLSINKSVMYYFEVRR